MSSKKRYRPVKDAEQAYHKMFDNLRVRSIVLNMNARIKSERAMNFNSRQDLKVLLGEYKGKEENTKSKLFEINKLQEQTDKINKYQGRTKGISTHSLNERFRTEARLDILTEEIEELDKLIGEIGEQEQKKTNSYILKYGPRGVGVIKGNILVLLDGQQVAPGKDGSLRIADKNSIYDGIPINAYYDAISKPWKIASQRLKAIEIELQRKCIMQGARAEFTERWETKRRELLKENGWIKLFSVKIDGLPLMPDPKLAKINA